MDYGHEQTDKMLRQLEKRIQKEYSQAAKEVEKSMLKYLKKFEKSDKEMVAKLNAGEISKKEYIDWRSRQMIINDKWKNQRDQLAEMYMNSDKVANEFIKDTTHETYALNHNYGTFEAEKGAKVDTSYTLYSKDTVARLVKDDPQLLPSIGKATSEKIRRGELKKWNERQIQSVMMQGILQGESIPKIAKRLAVTVGEKNSYSHIRAARTMTTSAENAGRIDSYKRAEALGIEMKKQWLATQDSRTRHSHVILDGESVPINEKFSNGLMFPADPDGAPAEVYNCRCTLIGDIASVSEAVEGTPNPELAKMDYSQWKTEHETETSSIPKPDIGETLKFRDEREVAKYFRGEVYDSKLKKSGFGIRDQDDKPATRWKNKLTFAQEQSIGDYTGDSYEPINAFLRGLITEKEAKEDLSSEFGLKSLIKNIDGGINKFKLDKPITVYRTCEREFLDQLSVGGIFHDDGYGSTSVLPLPVASGDVHFEIAVPSGKGIGAYVDAVSWKEGEEFEFLLSRGADYYIESIEERKDGIYVKASIAGFTRKSKV